MTTTISTASYTVATGHAVSVSSGDALLATVSTSITVYGSVYGPTAGIELTQLGSITNSGTITGGTGIVLDGSGSLTNSGRVTGTVGSAIYIKGSGNVVNAGFMVEDPTNTFSGSHGGVINILGSGTVINSGVLISDLTNGDAGLSFSSTGISLGQGTVVNSGTIQGALGVAVTFANGAGSNRFIADPSQKVVGKVIATGSNNFLELGSGATTGTIANPGNYIDFQTLSVDAGADWTIGTSSSAVTFSGISSIQNSGTLDILGSITGTTIDMEGLGAHSEVIFNGASNGNNFFNKVTDFGATDSIVVTGFNLNPGAGEQIVYNYMNGVLSVTANGQNNRVTEQFSLSGPGGVNFANSTGIATSGVQTGVFTFTTLANGDLTVTEAPQAYTFTGAVNTDFNNGSNYVGGAAPGYTLTPYEVVSVVSGTASVVTGSTLDNNGTILVTGTSSTLVSTASVVGSGMIDIASGGHVTLGGTANVTNEISFGTGGTALNPNLLDLSGTGSTLEQLNSVANFGTFDTIIVNGFTPISGDTLVPYYDSIAGVLHVSEVNVTTNPGHGDENFIATITGPGPGTLSTGNFVFSDGPNGLVISDNPCFAAGTRILTPDGEKLVEQLAAGDEVLTARAGHEGVAEIIWVGQRTIDLARHAMPEKVRPIRILAGAFGPGLPERDLRLSPDHALYIDGHLIEAKTLVNGVTVIIEENTRFVTYHHIETARHDVVLAEGLPAETYLESGNRANFENGAAPITLHPDFVAKSRKKACARLLVAGPVVIAARQLLLNRAIALGFAATYDIDLVAKAGIERIQPETDLDGELLFVLPAGLKSVDLLSGTGVPAELSADPSDRRVLGVNIASLALIAGGKRQIIALDDAAHEGFHGMEDGRRWTNGSARIALPAYSGRAVLEVAISGQAPRWLPPAKSVA